MYRSPMFYAIVAGTALVAVILGRKLPVVKTMLGAE